MHIRIGYTTLCRTGDVSWAYIGFIGFKFSILNLQGCLNWGVGQRKIWLKMPQDFSISPSYHIQVDKIRPKALPKRSSPGDSPEALRCENMAVSDGMKLVLSY